MTAHGAPCTRHPGLSSVQWERDPSTQRQGSPHNSGMTPEQTRWYLWVATPREGIFPSLGSQFGERQPSPQAVIELRSKGSQHPGAPGKQQGETPPSCLTCFLPTPRDVGEVSSLPSCLFLNKSSDVLKLCETGGSCGGGGGLIQGKSTNSVGG